MILFCVSRFDLDGYEQIAEVIAKSNQMSLKIFFKIYGPFKKVLIEFATILLLFYVLVFWP